MAPHENDSDEWQDSLEITRFSDFKHCRRAVELFRRRIEMSGHTLVFPHVCACCGGNPDTVLRVQASNANAKGPSIKEWDIPYCSNCVKHVRAAEYNPKTDGVEGVSCILVTVGIVFLVAGGVFSLTVAKDAGVIALLAGIILLASIHWWARTKREKPQLQARSLLSPDCQSVRKAMEYRGWQGSRHTFEVTSERYALEFLTENKDKKIKTNHQRIVVLWKLTVIGDLQTSRKPLGVTIDCRDQSELTPSLCSRR
jgi:hypothetical protein